MWIDRAMFKGPRVAVATGQRQYRALLRQIGASQDCDPYCEPSWFGCVHAFEVNGELVCIVGLNLDRLGKLDPIDAAASITHEAVHVWQRTRDVLGPGDLGREMEAYAIQNIAAELMRAYVKAISSSLVATSSREP